MLKKIIVLFKTHLDVGFTDLAAEIVKKYNEIYIPRAIAVGEKLLDENGKEGFVWTTGSWLIWQYLRQAGEEERHRMENAIRTGIISWHGLPFTMHSEAANTDLFNYGLSLSRELDEEFGVHTIGAKCTDVPGHTIAIVPLMQRAGIQLLHIGVNGASAAPEVPNLFRWRTEAGEEIVVMYDKDGYGDFTVIPETDTAVYFAHTADNMGPQSVEEIQSIYAELHQKYPEAEIQAGTLNDVADAVMPIAATLPVITSEIGDTWVHGIGSAPKKMCQYRALLRLAKEMNEDNRCKLYEKLLMIPEHTWGLDEKTFLHDHHHYSRPEFEKVRNQENYRMMERSWLEQQNYILEGVDALCGEVKPHAEAALMEYSVSYPSLDAYTKMQVNETEKNGWKFAFDAHGAVVKLEKDGKIYANVTHKLCDFSYEVFSEKEVSAFLDRYLKERFDWALEDFGKIGLSEAIDHHRSFVLHCDGIYENQKSILLCLSAEAEATETFGCPPQFILKITPEDSTVVFDFAWFHKPALRIPEALWLGFCFTRPLTGIDKLGMKIQPLDVVSKGNREMHCTQESLEFDDIFVKTLDAPLFAIEKPSAYAFYNRLPDPGRGVWFNLFNNQWGTNFPMWNEGDARFRFILQTE